MYNPTFIQTSRLTLRPLTIEDSGSMFQYMSDTEFSKYLNYDAPSNEDGIIDFLQTVLSGERGENLWAITLSDQSGVVGAIQIDIESHGIASLHYEIARWLWGQGLISEAITAILDFSKREYPEIKEFRADTHVDNIASRRVLEKFGFKLTIIKDGLAYYVAPV